jgi:hypothetical protein
MTTCMHTVHRCTVTWWARAVLLRLRQLRASPASAAGVAMHLR